MERRNNTIAILLIASAVMLIAGLMVTVIQQTAFADPQPPINPKKVTYCHNTPGNDNDHTVTTGAPSVAAHVRNHGDSIGACQPELEP